MPYVKPELRLPLRSGKMKPMEAGHLNYMLTMEILSAKRDYRGIEELKFKLMSLCNEYVENHHLKYQTANDVIGALCCCSAEFSRRTKGNELIEEALVDVMSDFYIQVVAPYEDKKIKENSDVYESVEIK